MDATATKIRSTRPGRSVSLDAACAEAVEIARSAAVEAVDPDQVGAHLEVLAEDERVATHYFECLAAGYRGWRWAVTVARASRARQVTVDEIVLLPGADAVLAPAWVPWSDRLRPGDLGAGDLLPTAADDLRLEPAYTGAAEDLGGEDADGELLPYDGGLERVRVLSRVGRQDAADRWYAGESGPDSAMAQAAPAHCGTCGFLLPVGGALRSMFGVCANEYSPSDGRVVSFDHGCGAHSEAVVIASPPVSEPPIVDEFGYDLLPSATTTESGAEVPRPEPDDDRAD